MSSASVRILRTTRLRRLAGATALACVAALAGGIFAGHHATAQSISIGPEINPDAQMLLEADTLIYDNDQNQVTAAGSVRIDYDGNRLVAERVTYDRATSRLIASGGVELIDSDGTRYQSDAIDLTDDFGDAFVRTLRVETPDRAYFAADSAERRDGSVTTFDRGVYTACEPCEEKPERPPVWRIKAQKIIWNGETKTVRFERAGFEFLGIPIAWLPVFEMADPTVERKTGFLFPTYGNKDRLGTHVTVPYYIALAPTYDVTLYGTYYTQQGFLGRAEWRQQFDNGQFNLGVAGIVQQDREAFPSIMSNGLETSVDRQKGARALVYSDGQFRINSRWRFGWDVMTQTDKNFGHTYDIDGANAYRRTSQIYLTGLEDRNFFDLRGYHFRTQERISDDHPNAAHPRQPWVFPSLDYAYIPDTPFAGGELSFDLNAQALHRRNFDGRGYIDNGIPLEDQDTPRVRGIGGQNGRVTAEAQWRRNFVLPGGVMFTPILHGQQDAIAARFDSDSLEGIRDVAANDARYGTIATDIRSAYFRSMVTAGLEARWPILFSTSSSTHILEPTAQLFLRPDEPYGNSLGIPNEDAQSLVFDAANLFERDKFSGYDRVEGGTRANIGLRYSGDLGNGWTSHAVFGQSYHLAGQNPYASPDLVYAGAFSGLETDVSDFVGMVGLTAPNGVTVSAGGRFDKDTLEVARTDVAAGYSSQALSISARYSFIEAQPDYGFLDDRHEVRISGSARVHDYWRVFGGATYDLEFDRLARRNIGFAYDDDCFAFTFTAAETRSRDNELVSRDFGVKITLRTLGDFGQTSSTTF